MPGRVSQESGHVPPGNQQREGSTALRPLNTLGISERETEEKPTAETREMPRKKGKASGKNKLRKDHSFLVEMFELYKVLEYAK